MTKLEREWAAKLRASGFIDLEGSDRDGPLSDRGNLHPVNETREEHERLGQRIAEGEAFVAHADAVLHNIRFASKEQREAWRLHAEGMGEREIATTLTITRGKVRAHLAETRTKVSKVSKVKRWQNEKKQRVTTLRRLVRQCDPETLTTLAALMLTQHATAQSRSSSPT